MASHAPPPSPEEVRKKHFGHLISTSDRNLIDLGTRVRKEVLKVTTTSTHRVRRIAGHRNLVFILELDNTKMVIRVPACGRIGNLTGPAEGWLQSQVQTLKWVRENTTIPVPEVYRFDTTGLNEIGAPYIATTCMGGRAVDELWDEDSGHTPLETRRRRILEHLAQLMSQLNVHRFNKIASMVPKDPSAPDQGFPLGPCFGWSIAENDLLTIDSSAPFESSKAWMRNYWAPLTQTQESDLTRGTYKLLKKMLSLLPDQTSSFALAPDKFDWANVMADEEGNITGLVTWDQAQTTPNLLGCLRYPAWIVHDRGGRENGPHKLHEYRAYYLEQMTAALAEQDPNHADDYKYTAFSKVAEAFWTAFTNPEDRVSGCEGFVGVVKDWLADHDAIPPGLDEDARRILENLGGDMLGLEAEAALVRALKAIMDP